MRKTNAAIVCSIIMVTMMAAAQVKIDRQGSTETGGTESLDVIVSRMQEAQQKNHANCRAYTMTRDYRLFGEREQDANSEVIANVFFVPPNRKTFQIDRVVGSSRGEKVVRNVLESESRMASQNDGSVLSEENYDFRLLGEELMGGQPSYVLELIPKRQDKTLIRGKAYIDKNTYLVHRVEGEMAKTPSWWLKNVQMKLDFSNAEGMWLQTGTRAVADVRIFGKHIFTARAIKVETADAVATTFSTVPPNFRAPSPRQGRTTLAARKSAQTKRAAPAVAAEAGSKTPTRHPAPVPSVVGAGVLIPR